MSFTNEHESENDESSILVVDFQPIVRLGLIQLINNSRGLKVCGEAENAHEALELIKVLKPDMAIVDISIKGVGGIELIETIKLQYPNFPILVFSMLDESFYAERVLKAGAIGYLMKHEALKNIINAIRCVLLKEIFVSEKISANIMYRALYNKSNGYSFPMQLLSNRELEVFRLIGQGYKTRRIAEKLNISTRTVEAYRMHIKDKLNLNSGEDLLRQAIKWIKNER
ncbi:MAG: response regulator transcription factor [bacterium]